MEQIVTLEKVEEQEPREDKIRVVFAIGIGRNGRKI
jgi:hypothetical protein